MGDIIRVFPRKTSMTPEDELAYFGGPPLPGMQPKAKGVHVSVTFTQDIERGKQLQRAWAEFYPTKIGGPALDDPGGEFTPGMYIRKGTTFTTRGCPKRCPWCYVWGREGDIRCLEIKPGYVVQDSNLLAAPEGHLDAVFAMLRTQRRYILFQGGIDADFVSWHLIDNYFQSIKVGEIWLSCDTKADEGEVERAIWMFSERGLSRRKIRCYVLIGFNGEDIETARDRLERVWKWGGLPFAMFYDRAEKTPEWATLQREWTRPAAMFANHKRSAG